MTIDIPAAAPKSIAEIRERVHCGWSKVAGAWAEHAHYVDAQLVEITKKMIDRAQLQPGNRVLELACGPGGLGLSIAQRVGPTSSVVVSDVVRQMTEVAAARAERLGFSNVSSLVLDLEAIDQSDGAYDAVLCRDGLMFAAEPARALEEMRRVLRPGGRAVIAVWGPREDNPWLGAVFDSASAILDKTLPPPGLPGPFALADQAQLRDLVSGAGFSDVAVEELPLHRRAKDFDDWWSKTSSLAGPLAAVLEELPPPTQAAIRGRLEIAVAPYLASTGLDFPGLALLASGCA